MTYVTVRDIVHVGACCVTVWSGEQPVIEEATWRPGLGQRSVSVWFGGRRVNIASLWQDLCPLMSSSWAPVFLAFDEKTQEHRNTHHLTTSITRCYHGNGLTNAFVTCWLVETLFIETFSNWLHSAPGPPFFNSCWTVFYSFRERLFRFDNFPEHKISQSFLNSCSFKNIKTQLPNNL